MPARLHINPGDKFGRYTIIKEAATINSHRRFLCRCECGTTKEVSLANLRGSHTRSCGCYMREVSSRDHQTHGGAKTRLYQIWLGMKKRCNNSKCRAYKWYGAEGVRLCPEWTIFDRFAIGPYLRDTKTISLSKERTVMATMNLIIANGYPLPSRCPIPAIVNRYR